MLIYLLLGRWFSKWGPGTSASAHPGAHSWVPTLTCSIRHTGRMGAGSDICLDEPSGGFGCTLNFEDQCLGDSQPHLQHCSLWSPPQQRAGLTVGRRKEEHWEISLGQDYRAFGLETNLRKEPWRLDQGRKSTQMVLETMQQRFQNAGGPHPPKW